MDKKRNRISFALKDDLLARLQKFWPGEALSAFVRTTLRLGLDVQELADELGIQAPKPGHLKEWILNRYLPALNSETKKVIEMEQVAIPLKKHELAKMLDSLDLPELADKATIPLERLLKIQQGDLASADELVGLGHALRQSVEYLNNLQTRKGVISNGSSY